jgi:hypothetical protein
LIWIMPIAGAGIIVPIVAFLIPNPYPTDVPPPVETGDSNTPAAIAALRFSPPMQAARKTRAYRPPYFSNGIGLGVEFDDGGSSGIVKLG